LFFIGCGGSGSSEPTGTNGETNDGANNQVEDVTNNFTPSLHLQKLGDNGTLLDDNADSWKIVYFIDEGIMVEAKTLSTYVKTFSFDGAKEYCDNLDHAGFTDWKLTNSEELRYILGLSSTSEIEMSYFPYYFNDKIVTGSYTEYSALLVSSVDDENISDGSQRVWKNHQSTTARIAIGFHNTAKAMCIRKD